MDRRSPALSLETNLRTLTHHAHTRTHTRTHARARAPSQGRAPGADDVAVVLCHRRPRAELPELLALADAAVAVLGEGLVDADAMRATVRERAGVRVQHTRAQTRAHTHTRARQC